MKNIEFKNPLSQRIYNDYLKRVKRNLALLSKNDQHEMMMEINSHIYESMEGLSDD